MNIAGLPISPDAVPVVIAEIGVNHDGSPARAIELADAAIDAGARAVKVQFFRARTLLSTTVQLAAYQKDAGETDAAAMLTRLELAPDDLAAVARTAQSRGALAICTVFTPELVDEAETLGFDAYKAASPDLVNRLLIERLAATGKPLILSTGAATTEEIARTLSWIPEALDHTALMHCVSAYPTPEPEASLGAIRGLATQFGRPVGYSDHTEATDTGALAVAAGACFLEKHLTHRRSAPGPDHAASLEPPAFRDYVRGAERAHRMVGTGAKSVRELERDVRLLSRQSLSLRHGVPAGSIITHDNLTTRRPGTGMSAHDPAAAAGRPAARDLNAGDILRDGDLE